MWHRGEIIPRLAEHRHFMSQLLAELDIFCDGPHRADPAFQPRHKQDLHEGSASERESSLKSPEHSEITLDVVSARASGLAGLSRTAVLLMKFRIRLARGCANALTTALHPFQMTTRGMSETGLAVHA